MTLRGYAIVTTYSCLCMHIFMCMFLHAYESQSELVSCLFLSRSVSLIHDACLYNSLGKQEDKEINGCVSRITVRTEEIELSSQFFEESLKYILNTVSSELRTPMAEQALALALAPVSFFRWTVVLTRAGNWQPKVFCEFDIHTIVRLIEALISLVCKFLEFDSPVFDIRNIIFLYQRAEKQ